MADWYVSRRTGIFSPRNGGSKLWAANRQPIERRTIARSAVDARSANPWPSSAATEPRQMAILIAASGVTPMSRGRPGLRYAGAARNHGRAESPMCERATNAATSAGWINRSANSTEIATERPAIPSIASHAQSRKAANGGILIPSAGRTLIDVSLAFGPASSLL